MFQFKRTKRKTRRGHFQFQDSTQDFRIINLPKCISNYMDDSNLCSDFEKVVLQTNVKYVHIYKTMTDYLKKLTNPKGIAKVPTTSL